MGVTIMGVKSWLCSLCNIEKPEKDWHFWTMKNGNLRRSGACKECYPAQKRMQKYKITYEEAKTVSDKICNICNARNATVVDHCHTYGHTRGFLCTQCNTILGFSLDSVYVLSKAISYLVERGPLQEPPSKSESEDDSPQPRLDKDAV